MIKMVIADMDGTLLHPDLNMSKRNIEAIYALQQKGILFSFATGRPDQLMKEYVDLIQLKDPIIMNNGGVIGNPFDTNRVLDSILDKNIAYDTISYCEDHQINYMIYTKEAILAKPNPRTAFFEQRNRTLPEKRRSNLKRLPSHPWDVVDQYDINKILIVEYDPDKFHQARRHFMSIPNCNVISSQSGFLDVNPLGTSKGEALKRLADYHNISVKDIVAFGDQDNDIEMLQTAGIGVAMGNANETVKQIADDVTLSNEEDGFAQWVEKHILQY